MKQVVIQHDATRKLNPTVQGCLLVIAFLYTAAVCNVVSTAARSQLSQTAARNRPRAAVACMLQKPWHRVPGAACACTPAPPAPALFTHGVIPSRSCRALATRCMAWRTWSRSQPSQRWPRQPTCSACFATQASTPPPACSSHLPSGPGNPCSTAATLKAALPLVPSPRFC